MARREEELPLEATTEFAEHRECLARYQPANSYLYDWFVAMMAELQGKSSPYTYAMRVNLAQKILTRNNPQHVMASQKAFQRIIRNLFPYDKISQVLSGNILKCIGSRHDNKGTFRCLTDENVKSETLIALRYRVLTEALVGYAVTLVKILAENLEEEQLPEYLTFADEILAACRQDIEELKRLRNLYYFDFPPEEVGGVSEHSVQIQATLKRRREMPKDMEPEFVFQQINKMIVIIRGRLQTIIIKGKEIREIILERKERYAKQVQELTAMIATLQILVNNDTDWHEITAAIDNFKQNLEEKFRLDKFLPPAVLLDIEKEHTMYMDGFI